MAYRPTKEKAKTRAIARQLYTKKRLSLEDIHQRTGETLKTLRAWRNLGQWDSLRDNSYNPEIERLRKMRDSLFDRIEAQFTDGKLPHTEIGLLAKVESMIERHEAKVWQDPIQVVLAALELLMNELREYNPDLAKALGPHLHGLGRRIYRGELAAILK